MSAANKDSPESRGDYVPDRNLCAPVASYFTVQRLLAEYTPPAAQPGSAGERAPMISWARVGRNARERWGFARMAGDSPVLFENRSRPTSVLAELDDVVQNIAALGAAPTRQMNRGPTRRSGDPSTCGRAKNRAKEAGRLSAPSAVFDCRKLGWLRRPYLGGPRGRFSVDRRRRPRFRDASPAFGARLDQDPRRRT